jgi:glycerol-3-phosphate dehydrogenase
MGPDFKKLEEQLEKYPGLDYILLGGVVSSKLCRTILDIDKWLMDDLKKDLLMALCIKGISNSTFRAVPEVIAYIQERITESATI